MTRRRTNQSEVDRVRKAWEEWENTRHMPGAPTAGEVASDLGYPKSTIYAWKNQGWSSAGATWSAMGAKLQGDIDDLKLELYDVQVQLRDVRRHLAEIEAKGVRHNYADPARS